jgi:hypothetical protein
LGSLHLAALLLFKGRQRIGLCLGITLRQEVGNHVALLLHQAALQLRALHPFAGATKGPGTNGLCRKALARDVALAVDLPHGLVDDELLVGVGERADIGGVVALRSACQAHYSAGQTGLHRADSRGHQLTGLTKLASGVGGCGALRGHIQVAQALAQLPDAGGDVAGGLTRLLQGLLRIHELATSVRASQDVSGLTGGAVCRAQRLAGSRHVWAEGPDTEVLGSLHGGLLRRSKSSHLVGGQLLRQGLCCARVECQALRLLQQT